MTRLPDLSTTAYLGSHPDFRAIGWIDGREEYPRGSPEPEDLRLLERHSREAWQPFFTPGLHACELCPAGDEDEDWLPAATGGGGSVIRLGGIAPFNFDERRPAMG